MACTYLIYDKSGKVSKRLTYQEIVEQYKKGARSMSDILFSRGDTQSAVIQTLQDVKSKYSSHFTDEYKVSTNKIDEEPSLTSSQAKFTVLTFIDDGRCNLAGRRPVAALNEAEYQASMVRSFMQEENLSQAEAMQKVQTTTSNWQIVNEDAKSLHALLAGPLFSGDPSDNSGMRKFIQRCQGTKYEKTAGAIYQQVVALGGVLHKMLGVNKLTDDVKSKLMKNINLISPLFDGDDISGHIDNLVIDADGHLHIYNYKVTATPVTAWPAAKMQKYKLQMAFLKQMLAAEGLNVRGCTMHIIPVQLKYSDDFSEVTSVEFHDFVDMPLGSKAEEWDTVARHFIRAKVTLNPISSESVQKINSDLQHFLPEKNIKMEGIQQSAKEWIRQNYTPKASGRIRKVNAPDHMYEVYFTDDFENPVLIKEKTPPEKNEELLAVVQKEIESLNTANNSYLQAIIDRIRSSRTTGKWQILGLGGNNASYGNAMRFILNSLSKYVLPYRYEGDKKIYEWDLIENEDLLKANILLFKNSFTGQIDVITLSDYDLRTKIKFKGRSNIMGSYISDVSLDTGNLIRCEASYGNIEALKTMIILNEILPQLSNLDDIKLGEMRIISPQNSGVGELFSISELSRGMFTDCIRVVNKNNPNYKYKNKIAQYSVSDPIDIIMLAYTTATSDDSRLSDIEQNDLRQLSIDNLENAHTKEERRTELLAIINNILRLDPSLGTMKPTELLNLARSGYDRRSKILASLYIEVQKAYCYYSGILVANEYKINKLQEYGFTSNRIPNHTFLQVAGIFTKVIDNIAKIVNDAYAPIYNFTTTFYNATGFSNIRNATVGDQARAFKNLFKRNENNEVMMELRNPYETDTLKPLNAAEKTYLKKYIYTLTKIRSEMYGFEFGFNMSDIDSEEYIRFVKNNSLWIFNVPLERASAATVRSEGIKAVSDRWKENTKRVLSNAKEYVDIAVNNAGSKEEAEVMERAAETLSLQNPYERGDGYLNNEKSRIDMIENHPSGYFETNLENVLAHYLEKHVQNREFNKALVAAKAVLLLLQILGEAAGSNAQEGIELTQKMIRDYMKLNVFNLSIMEPTSKKIIRWIQPLKNLVSKAYLAGNVMGAARDCLEGLMHNMMRSIIKYQTDITPKDVSKAYAYVVKSMFTSARNITKIDALCRLYRLSYFDVNRISEGLTTSRTGLLNLENWAFATIKQPDFLNRMVLFVARCIHDGTWDSFSLENGYQVKYDWKKDKRFSVYADPSKKGTKEYEEQRLAYFEAVRQYNAENPEHTIGLEDDLPEAYTHLLMQEIRNLANSILGAYDKSMKAKWEHTCLGLSFTMFGTWMNGMVNNYFAAPEIYEGGLVTGKQETDDAGNPIFVEKETGNLVVQHTEGDNVFYTWEATGEKVEGTPEVKPHYVQTPLIVEGIVYTIGDSIKALRAGGIQEFKLEILSNPMQCANLKKLISDLLMMLLYVGLFKLCLAPLYTNYKKTQMPNLTFLVNAFVELGFKSASRAFDGFSPVSIILFIGENTNPPAWLFPTKVASDTFKTVFGNKHFTALMSDMIAPYRSFRDSFGIALKKMQE